MAVTPPIHPQAGRDPLEYADSLRTNHAIVMNEKGEYIFLRHADIVAAARNPEVFSSAVSRFLQVPNGLDGADHQRVRDTLDPYLFQDAISSYADSFQAIAAAIIDSAPRGVTLDAVNDLGAVYAVRAMSAWLGWPSDLEPRLLAWMRDNHEASRSGELAKTAAVADEYNTIIEDIMTRQQSGELGDTVTGTLMDDGPGSREFSHEELVSILRNWTGGDLGSLALCIGVIVEYLVGNPQLADDIRTGMPDHDLDAVLDEILRIDNPFVSNRRKTTAPVQVAGFEIPKGAVVHLHWTSANRDREVFGDPDAFNPTENRPHNLVWGTGPHFCPGRVLATMQLRIFIQALLAARHVTFAAEPCEREIHPVGGFAKVPIILT